MDSYDMDERLKSIDKLIEDVIIPDKKIQELKYAAWKREQLHRKRVEEHYRNIQEREKNEDAKRFQLYYNKIEEDRKQGRE